MRSSRWLGLVLAASTLSLSATANAGRVFVSLDTSRLTVINDVADATFTVVVRNEEAEALAQAWLVFEDGFEVAVGDVPGEGSAASESVSRTFDLSTHARSLNVALNATLKYSVDGNAVERQTTVVLKLGE